MVIDCRALAEKIKKRVSARVARLDFLPLLVDVVVGDDPVSLSYAKVKQKMASGYGIAFKLVHLSAKSNTADVIKQIQYIVSTEKYLGGLIVQLPLPSGLDTRIILNTIPINVDVDVLSDAMSATFYNHQLPWQPPTAAAIMYILDSLSEDLIDKNIVVIGNGSLVGKPIAHLLKQRGLQVRVIDTSTKDIGSLLVEADVIISGAGVPKLITGENIKKQAIIIDAGTSETSGVIAGDVDFESVVTKAKYLTSTPGGVGPVTVAKLMENVIMATELKK